MALYRRPEDPIAKKARASLNSKEWKPPVLEKPQGGANIGSVDADLFDGSWDQQNQEPDGYLTTAGKGIARGGLGLIKGLAGSGLRWAGEAMGADDVRPIYRDTDTSGMGIADRIASTGKTISELAEKELQEGAFAADQQTFSGTFMENPSLKRAVGIVAEGLPSLAAAITTGGLTGSAWAGAGLLGLSEGAGQYEEAREAGKDVGTASGIGGIATIGNTLLEKLPIDHILKFKGGMIKGALKGAAEEGVQEGTQTLWQNLVAKVGYEPTRNLAEGIVEAVIGGAGSGGIMGAGTAKFNQAVEKIKKQGATDAEVDQAVSSVSEQLANLAQRDPQALYEGLTPKAKPAPSPAGDVLSQKLSEQKAPQQIAEETLAQVDAEWQALRGIGGQPSPTPSAPGDAFTQQVAPGMEANLAEQRQAQSEREAQLAQRVENLRNSMRFSPQVAENLAQAESELAALRGQNVAGENVAAPNPLDAFVPGQAPLRNPARLLPAPAVTVTPDGTAFTPEQVSGLINQGVAAKEDGLSLVEREIPALQQELAQVETRIANLETVPEKSRTRKQAENLAANRQQAQRLLARMQEIQARRQEVIAPEAVAQPADLPGVETVTEDQLLAAKRIIYQAHKDTGAPDDVAAKSVMNAQAKADERNEPMNLWRSKNGQLGLVPASMKSPFKDGELLTTIHPSLQETPAAGAALTPGDTFEHQGVTYRLDTVGDTVTAEDVDTGAVEDFGTVDEFAQATGQRVAGEVVDAEVVTGKTANQIMQERYAIEDRVFPTIRDGVPQDKAQQIVLEVRDSVGNPLGVISAPYDGTDADALAVAKGLKYYATDNIAGASMRQSRQVGLDKKGQPSHAFAQGEGETVMAKMNEPGQAGVKESLTADAAPPVAAQDATEGSQAYEVNGVKVYPTTLRGEERWSVQSTDNKGTDQVFGDALFNTREEAEAEARLQARNEAWRNEQAAKAEKEKRTAAQTNADKVADDVRGFAKDKNPMQRGAIQKALTKQYNFADGGVMTVRQRVESLHESGALEISTFEEPKIKPMTRSQFNRADAREQRAHEEKMKQAGNKTVYLVNGSDLGKTAYEYAQHLLANQAPVAAQETETVSDKGEQEAGGNQTRNGLTDWAEKLRADTPAGWVRRYVAENGTDPSVDEVKGRFDLHPDQAKNIVDVNGIQGLQYADELGRPELLNEARRIAKERQQSPANQAAPLTDQGEQAKAPWQMTREEYFQDALKKNRYRESYLADQELLDEFKQDAYREWTDAAEKAAEEGPLPDSVLDDYAEAYGENQLRRTFRGVKEKGLSQWEPKDVRVWDKTYRQLLDMRHELILRKGETKQYHRDAIQKALDQGKPVPAAVLKDYPELQAKAPAKQEEGGKIEDFGEVLEGARKHYAQSYRDNMKSAQDLDLVTTPLAKAWPEPNHQKLIEDGVDPWTVAFVRALRDELPAKPQSGWKVARWVDLAKSLRGIANDLISGDLSKEQVKAVLGKEDSLRLRESLEGRADLYLAVGHDVSLKGVRLVAGQYGLYNGEKFSPPKTIWTVERKAKKTAFSNWPTTLAEGNTREEAIANFKKKVAGGAVEQKTKEPTKFVIYSTTGQAGFFVGKKVGSNYIDLEHFDTAQEARKYREENHDKLEEKLSKIKDVPNERKEENAPRVGIDHRNGEDVTPESFAQSFGFRGVQFGNYVEGSKRQQDLNDAYDALMDLAGVLDLPSQALSLNGELGLAFGARGHGGKRAPKAHYEPGKVVINLTKTEGAGSLAHEWFHAVDNYFSRLRNDKLGHMTENQQGDGVRKEMAEAFAEIIRAINRTSLQARSRSLDATRTKAYWSLKPEMAARAFESYIVAKLHDQNAANDYLANIVSKEYWDAAASLGIEKDGTFPYIEAAELPEIRAAFDNFFNVVETKETDKGVALFSRKTDTAEFRKWFGNSVVTVDGKPGSEPLVVYHGTDRVFSSFDEKELGRFTGAPSAKKGFFFTNSPDNAGIYAGLPRTKESADMIINERRVALDKQAIGHKIYRELLKEHDSFAKKADGFTPSDFFMTDEQILAAGYDLAEERERFASYSEEIRAEAKRLYDKQLEADNLLSAAQKDLDRIDVLISANERSPGVEDLESASDAEIEYLTRTPTPNILPVYLKITNPIFVDFSEVGYRNKSFNDLLQQAQASGHDGAIFRNVNDPLANDVYVVFEPEQIKSVYNQGTFDPTDPRINYQRNTGTGIQKADLQSGLKASLQQLPGALGKVNLVQSETELPQDLQAAIAKEQMNGAFDGVYWKGNVYLVGDNLDSVEAAQKALLHETRHLGLDHLLGGNKKPVLAQAAAIFNQDVAAYLKQHKLDNTQQNRLMAAEEVLVDMVRQGKVHKFVDSVIAKVREWVRSVFPNLELSKAELRNLIANVDEYITSGQDVQFVRGGEAMAYQRKAPFSEAFKKWFGESKVVDENGDPLVVYHGTSSVFDTFEQGSGQVAYNPSNLGGGLAFFTSSKSEAESYAKEAARKAGGKPRVVKAYLSLQNPITHYNQGNIPSMESRLKEGRDGAIVYQGIDGIDNPQKPVWYLPYRADQIILFNKNGKAPIKESQTASFSRKLTTGNTEMDENSTIGKLFDTPEQHTLRSAIDGAFNALKSAKVQEQASKARTKLVDRMHPIEQLGEETYMQHRLLGNTHAVLSTFLQHGKLAWDQGALTVKEKGQGFLPWLKGLENDGRNLFYWVAAKRAEVLETEGRENWLTPDKRQAMYEEIFAGLTAEQRAAKERQFEAFNRKFQEYNQNVIDVARESGLLSQEQIDSWTRDFYLPFYRIMEDAQTGEEFMTSPHKSKKHVSAQIKRLKGGEEKIGDPIENVLRNWSHLIQESQRNVARASAARVAVEMGLATKVAGNELFKSPGARRENSVISYQEDGKTVFLKVEDMDLYEALAETNAKAFDSTMLRILGKAKRALTMGATVGPAFRIANLLRDTVHTAVVSKSFAPFTDTAKGLVQVWKESPDYIALMASGGGFGQGWIDSGDPKAMARSIEKIIKREGEGARGNLLDTPRKLWDFWERIGHASEMAARVQLYSNLKMKGEGNLKAAYEARDLLDFYRTGASNAVRVLAMTTPFLNARIQGLDRLYRGAKADPKAFLTKGMMVTAASLMLWTLFHDDERYKDMEDWEKWQYHHFWIGKQHFRIPKAFEVGALFSSMAESAAASMAGDEEYAFFLRFLKHTLTETFSVGAPAAFAPSIEAYANKSAFTGRPIEGMALERLPAGERSQPWTPELLKDLGKGLNLSPVKLEHMIQGHFAVMGTTILGVADTLYRWGKGTPAQPAATLDDMPGIGRFVRSEEGRSKYATRYYDLAREVNELAATVSHYKQLGEMGKARELAKAKPLQYKRFVNLTSQQLADIRRQEKRIFANPTMSAAEKRDRISALDRKRKAIYKQAYERISR